LETKLADVLCIPQILAKVKFFEVKEEEDAMMQRRVTSNMCTRIF